MAEEKKLQDEKNVELSDSFVEDATGGKSSKKKNTENNAPKPAPPLKPGDLVAGGGGLHQYDPSAPGGFTPYHPGGIQPPF